LLDFGLAKLTSVDTAELVQPCDRHGANDSVELATTREPPVGSGVDVTRDRPTRAPGRFAIDETARPGVAAAGTPELVSQTVAGAVIGTPRYLAPEIWRGEPATPRSDLYSLGVLLYELAAGVAPYPQIEIAELERAARDGQARPLDELAPELPAPVAHLVMRCLALEPGARPVSAAQLAHELEAIVAGAPSIPPGNPYRGLHAFRAEHRGLFFGRGDDVSALVDRFRTEALLIVAGDSGIGKSSVVHAGVVPAVVAGALADRRHWRAVAIVPGRRPWHTLCDALGIAAARVHEPASELVRAVRPPDGEGLLLVLDQLEELVTVSDPGEAARVTEMLAAIGDAIPGLKALLAVRGDFLTRVAALAVTAELAGFDRSMTRGLHLLRVLSPADLREAIVGPVRATGVAFESMPMVDELVDTVAMDPGALPLLQFALAELWQARDARRGLITRATLDALGGASAALARHADAVLFELGATERAVARSVLLRLVTGDRTRAVRAHDELVAETSVSASVLESLIRGRLVVARDTTDGTPAYELAHEALIHSWGTLGDWLDAAAGEHVVRNRLLASASEWQRLDRPGDLLWNRRQLDEAQYLADLTATEQAFVTASLRRSRWHRLLRIAAIVALPVIALAVWTGIRLEAARERDREVEARMTAATHLRQRADALSGEAASVRTQAFASFDARHGEAGEEQWTEARRLGTRAHAAYYEAEAELEAARVMDADAVRDAMMRVLTGHASLARDERDRGRFEALSRRLDASDPAGARPWSTRGQLVVDSPRAARIAVHARLMTQGSAIAGGFDDLPIITHPGPRLEAALDPGSYLVIVTTPGAPTVRDPVLIGPGDRLVRALDAPAARDVPAGFVYVAAGTFLFGSDRDDDVRRDFLYAPPLHQVTTGGYLIARTEVTFADWLEYLHALPEVERAVRRPGSAQVQLDDARGALALTLQPASEPYHSTGPTLTYPGRRTNQIVRWQRLPVSGVSWDDALAYLAWLDRSGRVPRARPCTAMEWERAARGADGRTFPTGDTLPASAANIDATYGRHPRGYGPDEVGSHPASDSPFGIADMAGNAWELVRGPDGEPWIKGGSWYQGAVTATSSNRNPVDPAQRNVRTGLRVCADAGATR
jgi:formylglycine-generating enzyme required for sulfatase activity